MQHACHCPPSSRLSHEEAHKGQGMHARNLLLWGWREGVQVVPLLMADSISIKLRMCKKQYKQNGADPAGNWGEIWPWRSKVEFTPSPASHRAGPSTVIVRRWFHCCMKGTRSHQQDKCVGVGEFWDPGDPMLLPVVGLISAPFSNVCQHPTPRIGPRITLDLMFLSCRLTQVLSFFKKSGLLLDFIISEGTKRPISKTLWNQTEFLKFLKLTVIATYLLTFP